MLDPARCENAKELFWEEDGALQLTTAWRSTLWRLSLASRMCSWTWVPTRGYSRSL